MDYKLLAEKYIAKQERFYNRSLTQFNKFLLKEFGQYIKKEQIQEALHIQKVSIPTDNTTVKPQTSLQGSRLKVALITEDVGHMTGGRYYCWFIACALVELGFDVTVYTNRQPAFGNEFEKYQQPEVKIMTIRAKDLENLDIQADMYLGSPISGNIAAAKLGAKYDKPAYALIFDPFPFMAKYLGVHTYMGWSPLIKILRETNTNIISLCNTTAEYIYDWLNKRPDQVFPIYPCINSREKVTFFQRENKEEKYVVFISRLVAHKNFDHVVRVCRKLGVKLKVISSVDGIGAEKIVASLNMKNNVEFCMKISDKEKFEIIQGAEVVINGAIFEGFGMWFIEAISCGIPTVCYDYPTIHEIKEFADVKNVYMAEWNNYHDLSKKLEEALLKGKFLPHSNKFDFEVMMKRVKEVFTFEPKIGVITIALNEQKFVGASLQSVIKHSNIKKVAVVEGAVNLFAHAATKNGLSKDNTANEIRKIMDQEKGNKIIFEQYGWSADKSELRNRALTLLGKDITHVLVVDADEVWKQEDLDNLVQAMKDNPHTGVFLFPFHHFWKNKDLVATGGQWNAQLFRCFHYSDKSLHWVNHAAPVVNQYGRFINVAEGQINLENVHVYHFGYCKDEQDIIDKLNYYDKRDGSVLEVKNTWSDWKEGKDTQPTHGGGTAEKFMGKHPKEIKDIL